MILDSRDQEVNKKKDIGGKHIIFYIISWMTDVIPIGDNYHSFSKVWKLVSDKLLRGEDFWDQSQSIKKSSLNYKRTYENNQNSGTCLPILLF